LLHDENDAADDDIMIVQKDCAASTAEINNFLAVDLVKIH
jgi:hypothetical protein